MSDWLHGCAHSPTLWLNDVPTSIVLLGFRLMDWHKEIVVTSLAQ